MHAVRAEALSRRFGELPAVEALDLTVARGEIFGLVGPDGAGKTTTMRLLTGILEPTSGDAWVAGHHVGDEPEAVKENIAYMSQRFGLYPDLTVIENIEFYADLYEVPRARRDAHLEELLAFSNLTPFVKRRAGNLSGGMKQKLGLACALVHAPRVLFLDEPTNGVDPVSRRDFWRILYQLLSQGVTIFLSTAYLDEAERCHRVGLLHAGRLRAAGTPEDVKRLMPGVVLELRTTNPRAAAHLTRERHPGLPVGLFGDRLHVTTGEPDRVATALTTTLQQAGLGPVRVRVVPPSLEDVFVSVLGDEAEAEHD